MHLVLFFGALLILTAVASPALAQSMFRPPEAGDKMMEWVNHIFVGVLEDPMGMTGPGSGLGQVVGVLNSALLFVGGALLCWNTIAGVAQSAHEGKILGKRWSSLWAPIRPVLGIALLFPLPSGYSAIQALVLHIALLGTSVANETWMKLVNAVADHTTSIVQPYIPEVDDVIREVLRREVCWHAVDRQMLVMEASDRQRRRHLNESPGMLSVGNGQIMWDYGPICGSVVLHVPREGTQFSRNERANRNAAEWIAGRFGDTRVDMTVVNQVAQQITAIMNVVRAPARQLALSGMPGTDVTAPASTVLVGLRRAYTEAVGQMVRAAMTERQQAAREEFRTMASAGGFVMAGSWYHTVARLNTEFAREATLRPTFSGPSLHRLPGMGGGQEVSAAMAAFDGWWRTVAGPEMLITSDVALGTESDSWVERVFAPGKWEWVYRQFDMSTSTNPLGELTSLGHNLLVTAETILIASTITYASTSGAKAAADNIPAAGAPASAAAGAVVGAWDFLKSLFFFFLGAMIMAGATLAYWLPMVPYILWLIALMAYLVFLVEAVIASVLWAFAHIRMDGEGIAGDAGRTGYELVLNLALRPGLMVLGLTFGYVLFYVGALFVGETFYAVMRGAQGSHYVGIVGLLVNTIIFVYLFVMLANKSFALIHVVPDRVSAWFSPSGRSMSSLGEEGDMQRGSTTVAGGVAKFDNAAVTSRFRSGGGGGGVVGSSPLNPGDTSRFGGNDTMPPNK